MIDVQRIDDSTFEVTVHPLQRAYRRWYFFKLYALDTMLELPSSTTKRDLEGAMQGHILGQAELVGKYQRR